jgi:hypothetical protein
MVGACKAVRNKNDLIWKECPDAVPKIRDPIKPAARICGHIQIKALETGQAGQST